MFRTTSTARHCPTSHSLTSLPRLTRCLARIGLRTQRLGECWSPSPTCDDHCRQSKPRLQRESSMHSITRKSTFPNCVILIALYTLTPACYEKLNHKSKPVELTTHSSVEDDDDEGPSKPLTQQQQAELLRRQVDTVGQVGQPGEKLQNIISVGMLSEGWDAKTVTHVMGLRGSQSASL